LESLLKDDSASPSGHFEAEDAGNAQKQGQFFYR
jgi:hypothetical protein